MIRLSAKEYEKLMQRCGLFTARLVHSFPAAPKLSNAQINLELGKYHQRANELRRYVETWCTRNIVNLYAAAQREVSRDLKRVHYYGRSKARADKYRSFNKRKRALLQDLFMAEVEQSLSSITKTLLEFQRYYRNELLNAQALQIAFLEMDSQTFDKARFNIARELFERGTSATAQKYGKSNVSGIYSVIYKIGKIPVFGKNRVSYWPFDKWIGMQAKQHVARALQLARRFKLLEHNHQLIKIEGPRSKSKVGSLYRGKVFALTKKAVEFYGVPIVYALPGEGAPFHPGSSYYEVPYLSKKRKNFDTPPDWALNAPWDVVKKRFFEERNKQKTG